MKVLYVSSHDLVGQQFNGYSLLDQLRKRGVDARMFVHHSDVKRPGIVYYPSSKFLGILNNSLSKVERILSLRAILPVHSFEVMNNRFYKDADIVHLQLIHASQFFSLLSLPRIGRQKKLVFTLHDPWMLTGHCVHPVECERWKIGCGSCPDLERPFQIKFDTTRFGWKTKHRLMRRTKVHLVVASKWMDKLVSASPILSHLPRSIIPLGLDTSVFKPLNKQVCKQSLGIPNDAFTIAFRAVPFLPIKGVEHIEEALLKLSSKKPVHLLAFDTTGLIPNLAKKYKTTELGWINNPSKIAEALNAADLFLMPSKAESFGMMAVESMACGTPVIVFQGTALPSVVHAPRGGISVPPNSEALKHAIESLINNNVLYNELSKNGQEIVREEYTIDKYVTRHMNLYSQIINEVHDI